MTKRYFLLSLLFCLLSGCVHQSSQKATQDPQAIADARIALGLAYLKQHDSVKAKQNLDRALEVMPHYLSGQLAMTYYYEQVGELGLTRKAFTDALKDHRQSGDLLNNYGAFLCRQKEYALSLTFFERAVASPNYHDIAATYENAALCAWQAKQDDKALRYFTHALHYSPNNERLQRYMIRWASESKQWDVVKERLQHYVQRFGNSRYTAEIERQLASVSRN